MGFAATGGKAHHPHKYERVITGGEKTSIVMTAFTNEK
jgi:hypothetical protein